MDLSEIQEIQADMQKPGYVPNSAQKRLAQEVTTIVHGKQGLKKALKVTEGVAPGKMAKLDGDVLKEIAQDMPHVSLFAKEVLGRSYIELAVKSGLLSSKGEANRLIKNGGAYLNNDRVVDPKLQIQKKDLIEGQFVLIGAGKKKKILVKIKDSQKKM